jgi:hypothetical protein
VTVLPGPHSLLADATTGVATFPNLKAGYYDVYVCDVLMKPQVYVAGVLKAVTVPGCTWQETPAPAKKSAAKKKACCSGPCEPKAAAKPAAKPAAKKPAAKKR